MRRLRDAYEEMWPVTITPLMLTIAAVGGFWMGHYDQAIVVLLMAWNLEWITVQRWKRRVHR